MCHVFWKLGLLHILQTSIIPTNVWPVLAGGFLTLYNKVSWFKNLMFNLRNSSTHEHYWPLKLINPEVTFKKRKETERKFSPFTQSELNSVTSSKSKQQRRCLSPLCNIRCMKNECSVLAEDGILIVLLVVSFKNSNNVFSWISESVNQPATHCRGGRNIRTFKDNYCRVRGWDRPSARIVGEYLETRLEIIQDKCVQRFL